MELANKALSNITKDMTLDLTEVNMWIWQRSMCGFTRLLWLQGRDMKLKMVIDSR